MDAPVCRICGEKHWSRVCPEFVDERPKRVASATPAVARNEIVAPRIADLETENRRLASEIERLTGEVAALKRELASRVKPPPMTATERSRKLRAKQKQVV